MNFFDNPIIMALCVILLLPLALKVAERIIPLIRDRVAAVLPVITGWMKNAFRWAGRLVTDDGELSPPQTVAQIAGAIFMIASAVVYTASELQFTWATLCPMLGGECSGEVFAGYDRLLSFSTVLLVVGFGLVVSRRQRGVDETAQSGGSARDRQTCQYTQERTVRKFFSSAKC